MLEQPDGVPDGSACAGVAMVQMPAARPSAIAQYNVRIRRDTVPPS